MWDDLSRGEEPPRVAQGTQLQGKAETVVWPAAMADVFQVVLAKV